MSKKQPEIIILDQNSSQDMQDMQESINKLLESGFTSQSIAMELQLSPEKVDALASKRDKELWSRLSRSEMKLEYLKRLNANIDIASMMQEADPNPQTLYILKDVINSASNLINDIDSKGDPQDKKNTIDQTVLQPLIESTLQHVAQELGGHRVELLKNIPDEYHGTIKRVTDDIMVSLGLILKQEHRTALDRLNEPLGIKEQKESTQSVGRPMKQSIARNPTNISQK